MSLGCRLSTQLCRCRKGLGQTTPISDAIKVPSSQLTWLVNTSVPGSMIDVRLVCVRQWQLHVELHCTKADAGLAIRNMVLCLVLVMCPNQKWVVLPIHYQDSGPMAEVRRLAGHLHHSKMLQGCVLYKLHDTSRGESSMQSLMKRLKTYTDEHPDAFASLTIVFGPVIFLTPPLIVLTPPYFLTPPSGPFLHQCSTLLFQPPPLVFLTPPCFFDPPVLCCVSAVPYFFNPPPYLFDPLPWLQTPPLPCPSCCYRPCPSYPALP